MYFLAYSFLLDCKTILMNYLLIGKYLQNVVSGTEIVEFVYS